MMIEDPKTVQPPQFNKLGVDTQLDLYPKQAVFMWLHVLDILTQCGDVVLSYYDVFPVVGFVCHAFVIDVSALHHW